MTKSNNKILIGAIGGGAILLIVLLLLGIPLGPLSIGERADLRLIAMPYVESSGIKDACLATGAAWHEDPDFVGCVGIGPNSCSSDIVLSGQAQCIGAGADFYCETGTQGFIYCRY